VSFTPEKFHVTDVYNSQTGMRVLRGIDRCRVCCW